MHKVLSTWLCAAIAGCLLAMSPAAPAQDGRRNLVSVQWLQNNLNRDDVVLIDASPAQIYAARHIAGALNVDVFTFGARQPTASEMEQRMQSWGLSRDKKVVIYDQGGTFFATSLFFDLYYHGFPAANLLVLDGGLAKWQAQGGQVTKDPAATPKKGSFRVTNLKEDARVRLPEFLVASGDPANHAVVDALEPSYHFGAAKFFDRAGHVPNAIMLPSADLFNEDKTFKSADEVRRMLTYLGIRPEQQVHTYCGGGIAASAPFFAIRFLADYPKAKLYKESQLEWLRDDRGLPQWTYDAPFQLRDKQWLNGWNGPMQRMFDVSKLSVIDVRPADAYKLGHVPFALSIPADVFRNHLAQPAKLAEFLGAAGVDSTHEAVIVSDKGLTPSAALTYLMLEKLGQKKISLLTDSIDDWGLGGLPLTKEPTVVGARKSPQEMAVPATSYPARLRAGVLVSDAAGTPGPYPKIFLASGKTPPTKAQDGKVIHVPYTDLLNPDGTPKPAKDVWNILVKAGVPRYAQIICVADDPGEAAVSYFILKLMGYPDVRVLVS